MKKSKQLFVRRLNLETYAWLHKTAKENGFSVSTLINRLVRTARTNKKVFEEVT